MVCGNPGIYVKIREKCDLVSSLLANILHWHSLDFTLQISQIPLHHRLILSFANI